MNFLSSLLKTKQIFRQADGVMRLEISFVQIHFYNKIFGQNRLPKVCERSFKKTLKNLNGNMYHHKKLKFTKMGLWKGGRV